MVLTNEYQYIGRSNAVKSPSGYCYYILVYAKTQEDIAAGKHMVTVKQTLVCDSISTFYHWNTSGNATVDGKSAFSWSWIHVPDKDWNTEELKAGDYNYPRWIDLREGTVAVDAEPGAEKEISVNAWWVMNDTNNGSWFPAKDVYAYVNVTVMLPAISSASAITAAANVSLGDPCSVTWTPLADSYRYKLRFSLGEWSQTTDAIHPGSTEEYTYTGFVIPVEAAKQIPRDITGLMTVTLYTYSDGEASEQIGAAHSMEFTITVPNDSRTQPKVEVLLEPVGDLSEAFSGLYIAGKTKVRVAYQVSSDCSTVESWESSVLGVKSTENPYTSDVLVNMGTVTITIKATDARGYFTIWKKDITVIPYSRPRIVPGEGKTEIVCVRCNSDGTPDPGGVYLLIQAGRKYSTVESNGIQRNFCRLSFRYKADSQPDSMYSDAVTLLDRTAGNDYVSRVFSGIVSSNTTAYSIRLIAEDDIGEPDVPDAIIVPTAFATFHVIPGGHGITFGGYHDPTKYNVFDCKFDAEFSGDVSGRALGMGTLPALPEETDANQWNVLGAFAVPSDSLAATLKNFPSAVRGTFRVWSADGSGRTTGNDVHMMQEYICYDNSATYRRHLQLENADSQWLADPWKTL